MRYKVGYYAKGISLLIGHTHLEHALKWDDERPSAGLHEIIPQIYTPHDYARQMKAMNIDPKSINKQIKEIWQGKQSIKEAPICTKKATTQERIQAYLNDHPNASIRTIAKTTQVSKSQVQRILKEL